jgi:hypothetical protein
MTYKRGIAQRLNPGAFRLLMDFDGHPVVVYTVLRHGLSAFAMKQKRKRKKPVARTPEAVAKFKELFLKQLALGRSPGVAARNVRIARSTAYGWKKEDQEFDAAWIDAVETALDALETQLYDSGLAGNSSNAQFILKHRRRDVYGNLDNAPNKSNLALNITLEEHFKQLERLGLPVPQLEGDYDDVEIIDAPSPTADHS